MDASSIQIEGTEVSGITLEGACFRLHFSRALIVKTMTGSVEATRWWQAGDLVIDGVEQVEGGPCGGPALCERGEIDDNQYTYRNMIPIPLHSAGRIRLELYLRGQSRPLIVLGSSILLDLRDKPKYIEHLRPGAT